MLKRLKEQWETKICLPSLGMPLDQLLQVPVILLHNGPYRVVVIWKPIQISMNYNGKTHKRLERFITSGMSILSISFWRGFTYLSSLITIAMRKTKGRYILCLWLVLFAKGACSFIFPHSRRRCIVHKRVLIKHLHTEKLSSLHVSYVNVCHIGICPRLCDVSRIVPKGCATWSPHLGLHKLLRCLDCARRLLHLHHSIRNSM